MRLSIIGLDGIRFAGEAKSLNIGTTDGELTVLDHHIPIIAALAAGTAHIKTEKGEERIPLSGGFLEVAPHSHVTVLAD